MLDLTREALAPHADTSQAHLRGAQSLLHALTATPKVALARTLHEEWPGRWSVNTCLRKVRLREANR